MSPLGRRILLLLLPFVIGCGATKQHTVTEQLLSSDAVDRAVAQIDFSVLSGRKVYVDASYVQPIKNIGFVNDRYILSSLRQQMAAAGCLLQDAAADADVVVEPRVGALGTDTHEVVYGLPANNLLANVASLAPNTPHLPTIPELAVAKKHHHLGAAKLAVFAYERETREPIWQSGIAQSESTARDVWVFGAGPFQNGTIYDHTHFAGSEIYMPLGDDDEEIASSPEVGFEEAHVFLEPPEELDPATEVELAASEPSADDEPAESNDPSVTPASHEEPLAKPAPAEATAAKVEPASEPAPEAATLSPEPAPQVQAAASPAAEPTEPPPESETDKRLSDAIIEHFERIQLSPAWPTNPWYNPSTRFTIVE